MTRRLHLLLVLALLCAAARPVLAQQPVDYRAAGLSRAELQQALAQREQAAADASASADARQQAQQAAASIRARLEAGDFREGDQIDLEVESDASLNGTYVVEPGPVLRLPIASIPLRGVLRSELQPHLRTELGRYYTDPIVRARPAVRVLVTGGVGKPGYYVVPGSAAVAELLTASGGITAASDLEHMRLERGSDVVLADEPLQQAISDGRTLDSVGVLTGDHLVVPVTEEGESTGSKVWAGFKTAVTVLAPIAVLIRLFR